MNRYISQIISSNEKKIDSFIKNQRLDATKPDFGGLPQDLIDVKPTVYRLSVAIALYLNTSSIYYKSEVLYERILLALDFIHRYQREDGTFDYPSCNFMSAPDTSFCLKRLIASYKLLVKYGTDEKCTKMAEMFLGIIKPAIIGVMNGGFHTPNHRWGICAALLQCSHIFEEDDELASVLEAKASLYLSEGIDCNDDGEYSERSTGNYNAVVNTALISIYEETGDPRYLDYVKRNLFMMLSYLEPDDSIFTQNSTRQDKGKKQYADKYFYQYLYLANALQISTFDAAAHKLIQDNITRNDMAPECLHILMLHPELQAYHFNSYGFLDTYNKYYKESGVVRAKNDKFTYSILTNTNKFLFMQVGSTPIYMRIGISYCSTRNFTPQTLVVNDDGTYTLTYEAEGWYYLPFENYEGTNDWWKMDHSKRELLKNTKLQVKAIISETKTGLDVRFVTEGYTRIPLRIQLCVPDQSVIENDNFYIQGNAGEGIILRKGNVTIRHEDNIFEVGPGFGTHEFRGHYSGEEKNELDYTLFFNDYSNLDKTIHINVIS